MTTTEFANERDSSRYTLRRDGVIVSALDYNDDGRTISFTRAFTNLQFRGNGYAADLTAYAVDEVEREGGRRIIPMCWYVADWFADHPERAHLLQPR
jgi:predicted GNAT family acetyltransferase